MSYPSYDLTFNQFQERNIKRCRSAFFGQDGEHDCSDWTMNDWAVALGGEAGEMMNILKKVRRGDKEYRDPDGIRGMTLETRAKVLKELADIITYADIMMSMLEAVTGDQVFTKFREVSERMGYEQ